MPAHLFLYGTLRPELVPPRANPLTATLTPVGRGTIRGRLYDLGSYPGAVLDAAADRIVGQVCRLPDEAAEALAALDRYEDYDPARPESSLYVRVPVTGLDIRPGGPIGNSAPAASGGETAGDDGSGGER